MQFDIDLSFGEIFKPLTSPVGLTPAYISPPLSELRNPHRIEARVGDTNSSRVSTIHSSTLNITWIKNEQENRSHHQAVGLGENEPLHKDLVLNQVKTLNFFGSSFGL